MKIIKQCLECDNIDYVNTSCLCCDCEIRESDNNISDVLAKLKQGVKK